MSTNPSIHESHQHNAGSFQELRQSPIGGKAAGLALLKQHENLGYLVPEYEEVDPSRPLDPQIAAVLERFKDRRIIVRSNSLSESGEMAGIYKSEVLIETNELSLRDGIQQVCDSFDSKEAKEIRAKHGILDDKIRIVVQEYVGGDFSGVFFTSNPSYPMDLTIEFGEGNGAVVSGDAESFLIEYDKETRAAIYESENRRGSIEDLPWLEKVRDIAVGVEKVLGPSQIEFVINCDQVYLVQRKPIVDLRESTEIKDLPPSSSRKHIATSNCVRGEGIFTLPVVKMKNPVEEQGGERLANLLETLREKGFSDLCDDPDLRLDANVHIARTNLPIWFETLRRLDSRYSEGYILVTPYFHDTTFGTSWNTLGDQSDKTQTFHSLTPNKVVVVTTDQESISSHIMDIARREGVSYLGFNRLAGVFDLVETGDLVTVHFKGRTADLYIEDKSGKKEGFIFDQIPAHAVTATRTKEGFKIRVFEDAGEYNHVYEGIQEFLNSYTKRKWTISAFSMEMGCIFRDQENQGFVISGWAFKGSEFTFSVGPIHRLPDDLRQLLKREMDQISYALVKHLVDKGAIQS